MQVNLKTLDRSMDLRSQRIVLTFILLVASAAYAVFDEEDLETLEFTTAEVTWLTFDLSPDGDTFILEVLGDLYTLPREGGQATQLTDSVAFDSQPAYSPDGSQLAFISDRSGSENLWVMGSDGSEPEKLTSLGDRFELASPAWSPDGSHIIVSKRSWGQRTNEIWAYAINGGKGVRLTRTGGSDVSHRERHNALGAVYSSDSKYIYYAVKRGGFGYNLTFPQWQIARKDLENGREDVITNASGSAFRPLLSPVDPILVYGTRYGAQTGLRIRDFETGVDEWLVYPIQRDEQESTFTRDLLPGYAFSPDGKHVFYTVDGKLFSVDIHAKTNSEIDFEIPIRLNHFPRKEFQYRLGVGPVRATIIRSPELNDTNSKLAFTAFAQIHTYDLTNDRLRVLTPDSQNAAQPSWSPNGKQIVYVTWDHEGGHVWTMASSGRGKPRQLTRTAAFYSDPLWLPDGNSIVVFRSNSHTRQVADWDQGYGRGADLVQIQVKSGDIKFIRHAGILTEPHLGPESDRIYLYETPGIFSGGNGYLVSIRTDGTDWQRHLSLEGPGIYNTDDEVPTTSIQIRPTGEYALAQHVNQLYLVQLLGNSPSYVKTSLANASIPITQLTDVGVDEFGWTKDGESIYWTVGHDLFHRPLSSIDFPDRKDRESESPASDKPKKDSQEGQQKTVPESDSSNEEDELREAHEAVVHHSVKVYRPRAQPTGTILLRDGDLITMGAGQDEVLSQTDILIENDRIKAIGRDLNVEDPDFELDLTGKFVLPGFVDTHAHFALLRRVTGYDAWSIQANLAYGVTTAIDVQPSTIDILVYSDLIKAGQFAGPRILTTGPGVFVDNEFKSQSHATNVLTRYKNHYGVNNIKAYISGSRKQRQWLSIASQELGLTTTTEGALDMKRDITHAIDGFGGNEHNLPVIGLYDDVVKLYAETRIAYTPTLLVSYGGPWGLTHFVTNESPWDDTKLARFTPPHVLERTLLRSSWAHPVEHVFSRHAAQALMIVRNGGRVGVGGHGELQGLGFHWELWAIASGGFSNFEALRAATRHGAEMIGVNTDVGSIEETKLADLVVLDRNPLEDIRLSTEIQYVIKNGSVYQADTLEELWPQERATHSPFWSTHIPPLQTDPE